ncbi:hypothetical protein DFS34DRAFT_644283 [Phlyctochytrium arcticum]|nr:hypothetical protein DFS34DRAFT_644283 [Phlyctochytrium arcticum]
MEDRTFRKIKIHSSDPGQDLTEGKDGLLITEGWSRTEGNTVCVITLTDGENMWRSSVKKDEMREYRPEGMTERAHIQSSRAAMAGESNDDGQATSCTTAKVDAFNANISWYLVLDDGIKFLLGRKELISVSMHDLRWTWMNWLEDLVSDQSAKSIRIKNLEAKAAELQRQREEILVEHQAWVNDKRAKVDHVIYKKFKEVLNAKKAKIRDLMAANRDHAKKRVAAEEALQKIAANVNSGKQNSAGVDIGENSDNLQAMDVDNSDVESAVIDRSRDEDNPPRTPRANKGFADDLMDLTPKPRDTKKGKAPVVLRSSDESDEGPPPALLDNLGARLRGNVFVPLRRQTPTGPPSPTTPIAPSPVSRSRPSSRARSRANSGISEQDSAESLIGKI